MQSEFKQKKMKKNFQQTYYSINILLCLPNERTE